MEHYVITIARQFGSLGRPIAKKLSEMLGIEYYDRDIVEETSKKLKLPVSFVSDQEENSKTNFFAMAFPLGMGTNAKQIEIFNAQASIIRKLAEKESCIIVGRCADYILRNQKNCVNVFIYASYETRMRNCLDFLHMEENEAKKMIAKVDKARESYHKTFTKHTPQDCEYMNIMIDSGLLGINGTAQILANVVNLRFGACNEAMPE